MIHFLLWTLASFIGSFVALLIWIHFHLEHRWRDRQRRHGAQQDTDPTIAADVAKLTNGHMDDLDV